MLYDALPNIILLFAILGIIILVLRRLPEAVALDEQEIQRSREVRQALQEKGLPVVAFSRFKVWFLMWIKKIWQFMLEAKDIKHPAAINYKIKRMFGKKKEPEEILSAEPNEHYYLEKIKSEPKNLSNYNALGNYYLTRKNFVEAEGVYDYLIQHDPANSAYHAKLGFIELNRQQYQDAVRAYTESLALDSSHPNRYYNLGLAYKALGKYPESAEAFARAVALEPHNPKYSEMANSAQSKLAKK